VTAREGLEFGHSMLQPKSHWLSVSRPEGHLLVLAVIEMITGLAEAQALQPGRLPHHTAQRSDTDPTVNLDQLPEFAPAESSFAIQASYLAFSSTEHGSGRSALVGRFGGSIDKKRPRAW
jgi:hypothetical protein